MRILFFLHRYGPSIGGVEKYIRHLAEAMRERGHKVTVVAGATQPGLAEVDDDGGVTIRRFPAFRSPLRCRWWLWRQRRLFADADVIQVSNTHMLEYLWRSLGPKLDRRRIFLIRHGYGGRFPVPEDDRRRAERSLRLANGFIHDGLFIEKWLGVRPDLVPPQGLSPRADQLPMVSEPPPTSAIYIGRLEPDTAIRLYLDGLRHLIRDYGRPFTFHVFGDGSLAGQLRAQVADEGLTVVFHGPTADAQERISEHCFAFVDGRMAIQEAMARRRAVIAGFENPLRRDYVGGEAFSPFLVAVGSGPELAGTVAGLIDQAGARHQLVEAAYQYAQSLSWNATAEAFEQLWMRKLAVPVAPLTLVQRVRASLDVCVSTRPANPSPIYPSKSNPVSPALRPA